MLRVGAGEVDVLEDAERLALGLDDHARRRARRSLSATISPGLHVAQQLGADDVEARRLAEATQ